MRLSLLFAALAGCQPAASPAPQTRTETVAPAPNEGGVPPGFCEAHPEEAKAPAFTLPPLDGPSMPDDVGWTWVSLWATWCVPCIEEMPLMKQWSERLAREGLPVTLRYVSVDASAQDLTRFQASHPTSPETVRLMSQESVAAWLPTLGVDGSASIPIHLFVDPQNRVRCVRVGAVSDSHYSAVKAVLRGL